VILVQQASSRSVEQRMEHLERENCRLRWLIGAIGIAVVALAIIRDWRSKAVCRPHRPT
jgi:hypothetical protein